MLKLLPTACLIFAMLTSCRTTESNVLSDDTQNQNSGQSEAFLSTGKKLICEDQDPRAFCAAVMTPVDTVFQKSCVDGGGKSLFCGKCQNIQACSIDITVNYAHSKDGTKFSCEPQDPRALCAAVMTPVDTEFQQSCTDNGGKTIYCGKCQNTQACSVSTINYAFSKDGNKFNCEPQDPRALCAAVMTPVDMAFQKSCIDTGGKTLYCGKCQNSQACSVDISGDPDQ